MTKKNIIAISVFFVIIIAAMVFLIPIQKKNEFNSKWGKLAEVYETDEKVRFIIDNEELYPQVLIDMLYINLEHNRDFVYNYPFHKDDYINMKYTAEELDGRVPALYMYDNRWCYQTLDGEFFIKSNGCALVSLTMAYIGLTGKSDLDPYKIMLTAEEIGATEGYFGGINDKDTKALCEAVGLTAVEYKFVNEDRVKDRYADIDLMKSILDSGHLIMVGMVGDTFGTHALIITGYEGDSFSINDPANAENSAIMWKYEDIEPEIYYMWDLSA